MKFQLKLYSAIAGVGILAFASTLSFAERNSMDESTDSTYKKTESKQVKSEITPLADTSDEDINATITYNYTGHANPNGWSSSAHPGDWAVHDFRVTPLGSDHQATLVEQYYGNPDTPAGIVLSQTVTGLGKGSYRVKLYATANRANGVGTWEGDPQNMAAVFANAAQTPITAVDNNTLTDAEPALYTVTGTVGDDGVLQFGIKLLEGGVGHVNWFCAQIYSIEQATTIKEVYEETLAANEQHNYREIYKDAAPEKLDKLYAVPAAQTRTAYEAAINEMLSPLNLRAVVESNALAEGLGAIVMTTSIVNPNAADGMTGWDHVQHDGNGAIGSKSEEAEKPVLSDGSKVDHYFDGGSANWGSGDWTNRLEQVITLPTGKYRISVLGRGSDSLRWFRFAVGDSNSNLQKVSEKGENATETEVGGWYKVVNMAHVGVPDDATFGKGWENYSLDFEVNPAEGEETADVRIGVLANSQAGYQWESFTYFRLVQLESDPTANYNAAKTAAEEALADAEYDVVTGIERTNLTNSIPVSDPTTMDGKKTAANEMFAATNAFKEAKTAYAAFKEAKEMYAPHSSDTSLAASDKLATLSALLTDVDNAEDAANNAAALQSAGRAVVKSNAIAEGVENRQDYTERISQAKISDGESINWTDTQKDNSPVVRINSGEAPEGDHFTHYFDTDFYEDYKLGGNELSQSAKIPAGKYRLALMARGSNNLDTYTLNVNDESLDLTKSGNSGQMFNRGWNDHTLDFEILGNSAEISVVAHSSQTGNWASWNDFRLTKIGEIESKVMTIPAKSFKTVCFPYAVGNYDSSNIEFHAISGIDNSYKQTEPALRASKVENPIAGVPYIIYNKSGEDLDVVVEFTDTPVEDEVFAENNLLKGSFSKTSIGQEAAAGARRRAEGTDVYYTLNDEGKGFTKVKSAIDVPANSAYVAIPGEQAADLPDELPVVGDVSTGINAVDADLNVNDEAIFDLQGRRVTNPVKGIYIRGGKKIVIR